MKKREQKQEKSKQNSQKTKNGVIIGLAVATGLLGLSTIGLAIATGSVASKVDDYGNRLEAVYQKNFQDLLESVNNAEIGLSKVLASSTPSYQKKMLSQVSDVATNAQTSFSNLPISQGSLNNSMRLLNQVSGYTRTLNEKLASGQSLTNSEIETLDKLHSVLQEIKTQLNALSIKMRDGYNILNEALNTNTDNNFTLDLSSVKLVDVDYPTMIYDGPFSDSVTNAAVKGLKGAKIGKDEARQKIAKMFKDVVSLEFEQDTTGRFETYNYRLKTSDNTMLYLQVTQIGGNILTVSGSSGQNGQQVVDGPAAQKIAVAFAKENGIENPYVVWSDQVDDQMYFNIAPTQDAVVLYPDLVKIKVDLGTGNIIGYDATTYFTNHVQRTLAKATFDADKALQKLPENFILKSQRIVLAPLEYNREVLCYEFACTDQQDEYYFYVNAQTGADENILRVIQTESGNKLL